MLCYILGLGCGRPDAPGVYTDVFAFRHHIMSVISPGFCPNPTSNPTASTPYTSSPTTTSTTISTTSEKPTNKPIPYTYTTTSEKPPYISKPVPIDPYTSILNRAFNGLSSTTTSSPESYSWDPQIDPNYTGFDYRPISTQKPKSDLNQIRKRVEILRSDSSE